MIFKCSTLALVLQIMSSLAGGLLPIAVAIKWKEILTFITENTGKINVSNMTVPFIQLAIVGALSSSFYFFSEIVDTYFRNKLSLNMQANIHDKSERVPTLFYEMPQLKDLIERAQQAFCYGPAVGVATSVTSMFSSAISVALAAILLFNFNSILAVVILFVAIPYIIRTYVSNRRVELAVQLSPKRREASEYTKYFTKYEYIKETKLWHISHFFMDKWEKLMIRINLEEVYANKKILSIEFILETINRVGYVGAILLSGVLLIQNKIGVGEFGAVIYLLGNIQERIEHFFGVIQVTYEAILNVDKGFEYLDLLEDNRNSNSVPIFDSNIKTEDATFIYPLTEKPAVDQLNVDIQQGEIIALVGVNGAGKTTITKLLLGLLNTTSGSVYFDSKDISNINYKSLYHNVSAVFQDFNHFYLSVRDNIAIGDTQNNYNSELLDVVSIQAGCSRWISDLPDGYNTMLGKEYGGLELSGGQWQQLSIARACFKPSKFIVLDEPTSALDPFNEEKLYNNFKALCKGKIGIIVTHRIGAASLADKILMIEDGKVVEEGKHEFLISKQGKYYDLFNRQSYMYKDEKNAPSSPTTD